MKTKNLITVLLLIFSCSTLIFAQDKKNENDEKNDIDGVTEQQSERETDEIRVIRFSPVLLIDWEESDADWEELLEKAM